MTLDEIDGYDPSEEQFASSLAGRQPADGEQELTSGLPAAGQLAAKRQPTTRELPDIAAEIREPGLPLTTTLPDESWRQEVSSHIQNYKARRRRSLGDESLSFNFESTAGNHVFLRPEFEPELEATVAAETVAYGVQTCATATALEPEYALTFDEDLAKAAVSEPAELITPSAPQVPETAKLIFFPKPPMMQDASVDQLADPVFDVPRIIEAPEETETVTVPLADITLQPDHGDECVPYIEPVLDLPVPVAPIAQRVFAECIDSLLVLMAIVVFGWTASKLGAATLLEDRRALASVVVLVLGVFWAIYKYVFLVHNGATPGMQASHLKLVDFEGGTPPSTSRRYRALAMVVSAFPLGLGLLWSFVDTEALCWHDRISKTYVTVR